MNIKRLATSHSLLLSVLAMTHPGLTSAQTTAAAGNVEASDIEGIVVFGKDFVPR